MVILKFGGTSVGTADRMQEVIDIIEKRDSRHFVVLSAMSGTTNALVEIADAIEIKAKEKAADLISDLEYRYIRVLTDLFPEKEIRDESRTLVRPCFKLIKDKLGLGSFELTDRNEILAQGELISTLIFTLQCRQRGIEARLIPALEVMRIDENGEPEMSLIKELVSSKVEKIDDDIQVLVTQGFICRNARGEVDNLRRGGSDYTATILGAVLNAEEVQIWTDIDGFQNNDPKVVDETFPVRRLSYREAAELAYFGAKILHPTCVLPAEEFNIPIRLQCTMTPSAPGTLITNSSSERAITAVSAKDSITAIKIYSYRMLQAYGFLRRVFEIFENHKTSVDMISTSEVAVSLTIDDSTHLEDIMAELSEFAEADSDDGYSIVCVVGNALYDNGTHVRQIFNSLREVPIRMVSMGGSRNNVSFLIKTEHKSNALNALNVLFQHEEILI